MFKNILKLTIITALVLNLSMAKGPVNNKKKPAIYKKKSADSKKESGKPFSLKNIAFGERKCVNTNQVVQALKSVEDKDFKLPGDLTVTDCNVRTEDGMNYYTATINADGRVCSVDVIVRLGNRSGARVVPQNKDDIKMAMENCFDDAEFIDEDEEFETEEKNEKEGQSEEDLEGFVEEDDDSSLENVHPIFEDIEDEDMSEEHISRLFEDDKEEYEEELPEEGLDRLFGNDDEFETEEHMDIEEEPSTSNSSNSNTEKHAKFDLGSTNARESFIKNVEESNEIQASDNNRENIVACSEVDMREVTAKFVKLYNEEHKDTRNNIHIEKCEKVMTNNEFRRKYLKVKINNTECDFEFRSDKYTNGVKVTGNNLEFFRNELARCTANSAKPTEVVPSAKSNKNKKKNQKKRENKKRKAAEAKANKLTADADESEQSTEDDHPMTGAYEAKDPYTALDLFKNLVTVDLLEGKIVYTQNVISVETQLVAGTNYSVVYQFDGKRCHLQVYHSIPENKFFVYHDKADKIKNEHFMQTFESRPFTEDNCVDVYGSAGVRQAIVEAH